VLQANKNNKPMVASPDLLSMVDSSGHAEKNNAGKPRRLANKLKRVRLKKLRLCGI